MTTCSVCTTEFQTSRHNHLCPTCRTVATHLFENCEQCHSPRLVSQRGASGGLRDFTVGHDDGEREIRLCNLCVARCDHCNAEFPRDGEDYCETCRAARRGCPECGTWHWGSTNRCDDCRRSEHRVRNYTYKPEPKFIGEGPYYFGYELEVETPNVSPDEVALEFSEAYKSSLNFYMKSDGSLSNGFEIVSHPHTYEAIMDSAPLLEKAFRFLASNGARSHDTNTCGLHIHISRSAFLNQDHLDRFGHAMNNFEQLVRKVARRSYSRYCERDLKPCSSHYGPYNSHDERYKAVNFENKNTVEVRVFKGTLKLSSFLAAFQLVKAMVEWTALATTANVEDPIGGLTKVLEFISNSDYEYLKNILSTETN